MSPNALSLLQSRIQRSRARSHYTLWAYLNEDDDEHQQEYLSEADIDEYLYQGRKQPGDERGGRCADEAAKASQYYDQKRRHYVTLSNGWCHRAEQREHHARESRDSRSNSEYEQVHSPHVNAYCSGHR